MARLPDLLHKDVPINGFKVLDEERGIVEAFVAVIGNRDSVGDIILPGAFKGSLSRRVPKGVWSHNWDVPVAKTLEAREVGAGDPALPQRLKIGGFGALYVKMQFNLKTQRGRDAYEDVKFFEDEAEWSIGYMEIDAGFDKEAGANLIAELDLFEYSPVLFGANPLTSTVSVKVAPGTKEEDKMQVRVAGVEDKGLEEKVAAAVKSVIESEVTETPEGTEATTVGSAVEVDPAEKSVESDAEIEKKVVPGSFEERFQKLMEALSAVANGWAFPVATFDDSVVYVTESFDEEAGAYKTSYFRASYSIDENGTVTLGESQPVDVVEVVVAKEAQAQADAKTKTKTAPAPEVVVEETAPASPEGHTITTTVSGTLLWNGKSYVMSDGVPFTGPWVFSANPAANGTTTVSSITLYPQPIVPEVEEKAGRVLSKKNLDRLQGAVTAIEEVIAAAGNGEEGEEKSAVAEKTFGGEADTPPTTPSEGEPAEGDPSKEDETQAESNEKGAEPHVFSPDTVGNTGAANCTVCGHGIDGTEHMPDPDQKDENERPVASPENASEESDEEKSIALDPMELASIEMLLADVALDV